MVRVAILGAGGQVGSNLLKLAADKRLEVWGVCRNEVTAGPLRMAGADIRVGSASDPAAHATLFEGADVILNCAAAGGLPAQARREDEALLRSLCQVPASVRIIHFSSVAVYGTCIAADRNTFENPRPDWQYGRHKLHLENFLKRHAGSRNLTILRMGHVYGAGQWLSGFALGSAKDPAFRLPLDGKLPSNAVHVSNVVEAVRSLIFDEAAAGTFNLFDPGQSSWRQVFDWNTSALGWPPVEGMSSQEAEPLAAAYRHTARTPLPARLTREGLGWLRQLPTSFVSATSSSKSAAMILLAWTKSDKFENWLLRLHNSSVAAAEPATSAKPPPPYLFCEGAPGPLVSYQSAKGGEDEDALRAWHRRSTPEAILHWQ